MSDNTQATGGSQAAIYNDGGPAYPLQSIGPDFPPGHSGMTLRQWYRGQALAALRLNFGPSPIYIDEAAKAAFAIADAMIALERKEQEAQP